MGLYNMSQKKLIVAIAAVVVALAGLWFVWQRRGPVTEERALEREIQTEVEALNTDMADLESRLPK